MKHKYHKEAERELIEATQWYERQQEGLASDFLEEIEHAVDRILEGPESYPVDEGEVRYCSMRRFPYVVLYRPRSSVVEIVAVMHQSRRPGYWKQRVSDSEKD